MPDNPTDNLKLTAEQQRTLAEVCDREQAGKAMFLSAHTSERTRELLDLGLVQHCYGSRHIFSTKTGRDLLARLDAAKGQGVELTEDEWERLEILSRRGKEWSFDVYLDEPDPLEKSGLVIRSRDRNHIRITPAGSAALASRQKPVEIHVNTRGCEPMERETTKALADSAGKLKAAYSDTTQDDPKYVVRPLDCECSLWATTNLPALLDGNGHNPTCPKFIPSVGATNLLAELVEGIKTWAAEENGVPDWLWEAYRNATFRVSGKWLNDLEHAPTPSAPQVEASGKTEPSAEAWKLAEAYFATIRMSARTFQNIERLALAFDRATAALREERNDLHKVACTTFDQLDSERNRIGQMLLDRQLPHACRLTNIITRRLAHRAERNRADRLAAQNKAMQVKLANLESYLEGYRQSTEAELSRLHAQNKSLGEAMPDTAALENAADLLDEAPYRAAANRLRSCAAKIRAALASPVEQGAKGEAANG